MHKKEVFFPSKRAQVTVFIILGIVIFLIFVFLFYLSANIKRTELMGEREEVLGRAFNKEALRLFVTDCLEFSLEKGLQSLGQNGTFWRNQGGLVPFQEDAGVDLGDRKVAYGIRREKTEADEPANLYPCDLATAGICPYRFPDTTVGFGELQFPSLETYENDLAGFLKKEARACAETWIQDEIYPGARVEGDEGLIDMDVMMTDTSILIAARYPLTFIAAGEEYFHLFEFGLDYDSQLRQFLEAAVIYPMRWDWKYVDFAFTPETLSEQIFNYGCILNGVLATCPHTTFADRLSALGVRLEPPQHLDNGDTLFTFTVNKPGAIIKNKESYTFTIARQNRPPALDYIQNVNCPNADVLVVLDTITGGNNFEFPFHVWDPDEDQLTPESFSVSSPEVSIGQEDGRFQLIVPIEDRQQLLTSPLHTVKIEVSDEYGEKDWQEVRLYFQQQPSEGEGCPPMQARRIP